MLWKTWPRKEEKNSFLDGVDTFRLVQGQMKVQQPCYNLCQSQKLLWCSFQINNIGYRINYFAHKTRSQKYAHTQTVKISVICVQKFHAVKNIWEGHFSRFKSWTHLILGKADAARWSERETKMLVIIVIFDCLLGQNIFICLIAV